MFPKSLYIAGLTKYNMSNIVMQVRKLYPKGILFSLFVIALGITAKFTKLEKKEETISEFRYVMD